MLSPGMCAVAPVVSQLVWISAGVVVARGGATSGRLRQSSDATTPESAQTTLNRQVETR